MVRPSQQTRFCFHTCHYCIGFRLLLQLIDVRRRLTCYPKLPIGVNVSANGYDNMLIMDRCYSITFRSHDLKTSNINNKVSNNFGKKRIDHDLIRENEKKTIAFM